MKCDRCGDDVRMTTTRKNVHFDTAPVSRLVSTYTVCNDCDSALKDDPKVSWR